MNPLVSHKNIPLVGQHNRPIVTDFLYANTSKPKPVVVFCHGYKGYKDWGAWPLMLQQLAEQGNFVVSFNFSHNGGTIQEPIDFPDLEAFANDNFSIQQDDLQSVIDEVLSPVFKFVSEVNTENVTLIGHSRGGGVVILKAAAEKKITKIVSLAPISTYDTSFPTGKVLENWKKEGVMYVTNGRTQQEMPLYFQLYEDYQKNKASLHISAAAEKLTIPHLIVHGIEDKAVTVDNAELLHAKSKQSELFLLSTDHVFGAKQPWEPNKMPEALQLVTDKITKFLSNTK